MRRSAAAFPENAREALADGNLQAALGLFSGGIGLMRRAAAAALPEYEALREEARAIKDHTLAHLDFYLERFEERVRAAGGHVHWCETPEDARRTILALCREAGARTVTKGKSIITEEIGLNGYLAGHGIRVVETDLGEYIIQLAGETPSHIIAPAIHKTRKEVSDLFHTHHAPLGRTRYLEDGEALVAEAREVLRDRYFEAEAGITGANFLVAETGSTVIVTNEGNGDLTQTLARTHIVAASLEKIVPTLEDAATLLRVLPRAATGQEASAYVTVATGPRRPEDEDGPESFHVVILDNGRSDLLGGRFRDILRCIRCGACMNACPVYRAVGGHAYGAVYVGPMGAVLAPRFDGLGAAHHLPKASTVCGACAEVCPVKIPLPDLMHDWREEAHDAGLGSLTARLVLGLWAAVANRPRLYRALARMGVAAAARLAGRTGFRRLPFLGGWTASRDFPAPEGETFLAAYRRRQRTTADAG